VFLLFIFSSIALWSEKILDMISIFKNMLSLVLWWYLWRTLHVLIRKMCIHQLLDRIFCICLLNPFVLRRNFLFIFCLDDLYIAQSKVLKSSNVIILEPIFPCKCINTYFIYLGAVILRVYIFRIVSSSGWIDPFFIT
jgi:hypothetical protein